MADSPTRSYAASEVLPFGYHFQASLLAIAYREPKFMQEHEQVLQAKYFENEEFRHLARVLLDHFVRYGRTPDLDLAVDVVRQYAIDHRLSESARQALEISIEGISTLEIANQDWVIEQATRFAQAKAMKSALVKAVKTLDDPDKYGEVLGEIERALEIAAPRSSLLRFRDVALDIPTRIREQSTLSSTRRIKTGLSSLDEHMFGGSAPGKLGVILAPSGSGKTHFMVFLGAAAIRAGHSVFHYTLGDMGEWEVMVRYAANFTGIDSKKIFSGTGPDYTAAMTRWMANVQSDLVVSVHTADSLTPSALRSHISATIVKTGIRPSLIIVDYADNLASGMAPTVNAYERYEQLGYLYQQLLKIGYQFDAAVWTGSQVGRMHWSDDVIDRDAVSASVKKIEHADYVLTLNQTREEAQENKARIFEAKIRFGEDKHVLNVRFDKATSNFIEESVHEAASAPAKGRLRKRGEKAPEPAPAADESEVVDPRREKLRNLVKNPLSNGGPK